MGTDAAPAAPMGTVPPPAPMGAAPPPPPPEGGSVAPSQGQAPQGEASQNDMEICDTEGVENNQGKSISNIS